MISLASLHTGTYIYIGMNHHRRLSLQDHSLMYRRRALTDIKELDERRPEQASSEQSLPTLRDGDATDGSSESVGDISHSPVYQAVLENNVELLKTLIENGADMNELDAEGWPPLHTAIRRGKTECAAYLLKQGAGDFYYKKQKQDYLHRLERSKTKTRKVSHWR